MTELQRIQYDLMGYFDAFCKKNNIPYFVIGGTVIGCVRHQGFIPWDDDIDVGLFREDYDRFVELASKEWNGDIQVRNYKITDGFYHSLTHVVDSRVAIVDESRFSPVKTNVWIDICPIDGFPENKIFRKIHYLYLRFIKNLIVLSQFDTLFDKNKKHSRKAWILISIIRKINVFKLLNTKSLIAWLERVLRSCHPKSQAGNFLGRYGEKEIMPKDIFASTIQMPFEGSFVPVMAEYDDYLKRLYGDYMQLPPLSEQVNRHGMKIVSTTQK